MIYNNEPMNYNIYFRLPILLITLNILPCLSFAQDIPKKEYAKCSLIKNGVERLACFDKISKKYSLDKPALSTTSKGNWVGTTETSPIDDSTNVYIGVLGEQEFKGWLKTHRPYLTLRCKENVTDVLVKTGMAPDVEYGHDRATATLRYDKEKAFKLRMFKSTNGEALFFPSSISNIKKMRKHQTLLFQFTPYNSNPTMTTFNISGLSEAIKPLRKNCKW